MEEVKEIVDTVTVELANGGTQEVTDVVIQEVNHALLSAGMDEALADKVDNFVILLLIIGVALLANLICRKIILRTVAKLVKQTKATWDDIVFDHKVMVHVSRMVAPILIYYSHRFSGTCRLQLARFPATALPYLYLGGFPPFHQCLSVSGISCLQ